MKADNTTDPLILRRYAEIYAKDLLFCGLVVISVLMGSNDKNTTKEVSMVGAGSQQACDKFPRRLGPIFGQCSTYLSLTSLFVRYRSDFFASASSVKIDLFVFSQ